MAPWSSNVRDEVINVIPGSNLIALASFVLVALMKVSLHGSSGGHNGLHAYIGPTQ